MTEDKTTITDNEVIGAFDGWIKGGEDRQGFWGPKFPWYKHQHPGVNLFAKAFKYHTSWEWLMPVWYKFRDMNTDGLSLADYKTYRRHWYELANDIPRKPIADVCKLLADGIRWYNSTQNKEQS